MNLTRKKVPCLMLLLLSFPAVVQAQFTFTTNNGALTITGYTGHDLIAGNAGNDRLYGQSDNDVVLGGDGLDYITGDSDNDLLFDGSISVTSPAGTDASDVFGDLNDQAMTALLADWLGSDLSSPYVLDLIYSSNHDSVADSLSGGLGNDTASKSTGDTGDWENTL